MKAGIFMMSFEDAVRNFFGSEGVDGFKRIGRSRFYRRVTGREKRRVRYWGFY